MTQLTTPAALKTWRLALVAGFAIAPMLGCASADPLAGKGSTASPTIQKQVTQVQADAAAGVVAVPQPASETLVCNYTTPAGQESRTIADDKTCPKTPPG